ncbi:MAG: hypothetical protein GC152_11695 [Alphaproteobacteria bacterium]|nr:hypothetical protein [Alphaproteobacteria bacterium]
MIAYDDSGYAARRPIRPDQWTDVAGDMPPGLVVATGSMPPGFLLVQNYLPASACDQIVAECERRPGVKQGVAAGEADTSSVMRSSMRMSEAVDPGEMQGDLYGLARQAFRQTLAGHYGVQFDWFERPEILRYDAGGEYKPHADAENWFAAEKAWKRVLDRDFSILLYLNEGFAGGEIAFPNFGLKLSPRKGLLIAFPSDARYLHAALPVTAGRRYALVSWAAVKGSPRALPAPPADAERIG